jgi:hypothetical protein
MLCYRFKKHRVVLRRHISRLREGHPRRMDYIDGLSSAPKTGVSYFVTMSSHPLTEPRIFQITCERLDTVAQFGSEAHMKK